MKTSIKIILLLALLSLSQKSLCQPEALKTVSKIVSHLMKSKENFESLIKPYSLIDNYKGEMIKYKVNQEDFNNRIMISIKDEKVTNISITVGSQLSLVSDWKKRLIDYGFILKKDSNGIIFFNHDSKSLSSAIIVNNLSEVSITISVKN